MSRFFISEVEFIDLLDKNEGLAACTMSFSEPLLLGVDEGDDEFFNLTLKIAMDSIGSSTREIVKKWQRNGFLFRVTGSFFLPEDTSEAQEYLDAEYGGFKVVNEDLDTYYHLFKPQEAPAFDYSTGFAL